MGSNFGDSEIVESNEGPNSNHKMLADTRASKHSPPTSEPYSLENDLNQLIKSFQLRTPPRGSTGPVRASKQLGINSLQNNAIKRPSRVGASQLSGIGISETVTLKQALRGLCISQASEMAAMKRLSRPAGCSGPSDPGAIKRLYKTVVVKAGETGGSLQEKGNLFEISLVPEKDSSSSYENKRSFKENQVNEGEGLSEASSVMEKAILNSSEARLSKLPKVKLSRKNVESSPHCSVPTAFKDTNIEAPCRHVNAPAKSDDGCEASTVGTRMKGKISLISSSTSGSELNNSDADLSVMKPIRNTQKGSKNPNSASDNTNSSSYLDRASVGSDTCRLDCQKDSNHKNVGSETSSANDNIEVSSIGKKSIMNVPSSCSGSCHEDSTVSSQMNESMRTKEKELSYPSSKSSIGDNSSGTSISDDSNLSSNAGSGSRPHMSKDWRWEAIHHVEMQHRSIGFEQFKLLKRLGSGDIGTVYLAELLDTSCPFALKIMDIDFLARRRKTLRAQTEREILQMLDHPFLPTLYTHFMTDKLSCFVMEYCPGGDLHVLRQTQPGRCFSEQAARFYVAEVLLALEYLHMLGVVYRDLKPENVLVREDGHIMLSDFDLSLRCAVNPRLLKSSSQSVVPGKRSMHPCAESPCIDPLCLQPAWVQVPCFTPRLVSSATRTGKSKSKPASQARPLPQLVAEPTDARSNSFVGTHEYLAPEIIKGEGHGSAVDWWTFGIFLYELLFGRTPFKGLGNEDTLANAVLQSLEFPDTPAVSFHARDLIGRLLVKEPENRLGSVRGSAEIKQHPFFEGLNWALIRCAMPPEIPGFDDYGTLGMPRQRKQNKCLEVKITEEHLEFELF